jgi:hypothetical protein
MKTIENTLIECPTSWQAVGLTNVSQFFIKKAIEDATIACPTSCLSGASRQAWKF